MRKLVLAVGTLAMWASALPFASGPTAALAEASEEPASATAEASLTEEYPSAESEPIASTESGSAESASEEPSSESASEETSDNAGGSDSALSWQSWLADLVSPSTLATITAILAALAAVVKMAASLKDMAKSKQMTVESVSDVVVTALKESLGQDMATEIDRYLPQLVSASKKTDRTLEQFAKILALSQEGTSESRLAVLNAIQELGLIANETVEEAKAEVTKQAEQEAADKQAKKEAVEQVIAETSDSEGETEKKAEYDGTTI